MNNNILTVALATIIFGVNPIVSIVVLIVILIPSVMSRRLRPGRRHFGVELAVTGGNSRCRLRSRLDVRYMYRWK